MTAKLSKNGRVLRSKFEAALQEHHAKKPIYNDLKLTSPTLKEDALANIEQAKRGIHNNTLAHLFTFGLLIDMKKIQPSYHLRSHANSTFLYKFFEHEMEALPHLIDVSIDLLNRTSANDKKEIIRTRSLPTDPEVIDLECPTEEVQELNSIHPGDMWYSDENPLKMSSYKPPFAYVPPAENPSDAAVLDWIFGITPPLEAPAPDEQNKLKHVLVAPVDHEELPLKRR